MEGSLQPTASERPRPRPQSPQGVGSANKPTRATGKPPQGEPGAEAQLSPPSPGPGAAQMLRLEGIPAWAKLLHS